MNEQDDGSERYRYVIALVVGMVIGVVASGAMSMRGPSPPIESEVSVVSEQRSTEGMCDIVVDANPGENEKIIVSIEDQWGERESHWFNQWEAGDFGVENHSMIRIYAMNTEESEAQVLKRYFVAPDCTLKEGNPDKGEL